MSDVLIYGDIGKDVTGRSVADQLAKADGHVTVHVNSGGGDVYEGIAVLNALRAYDGEMTVIVESLAASAASFIAVGAGAPVKIRPNAELMLHKAWTMPMGNADSLRKTLADLDRQDVKLAQIYADRAGGTVDEWLAVMAAETWYTAQEAVDAGLVDEIEDAKRVREPVEARSHSMMFAHYKYSGRETAPPPAVASHKEDDTSPARGEGDTVSILNQLAEAFGKKPDEVKNALSGLFNEVVPISGEVEVSYPTDVKIVPTERIKVEPIIGDKKPDESAEDAPAETAEPVETENAVEPVEDSPAVSLAKSAGMEFEMGAVADGFEASVDEGGVVTIKAPAGAEPGSTAEFTVRVNGTDVALTVAVRSLSDDEDENASDDSAVEPAAPTENTVTLDAATYNDLKAAARAGWEALEAKKESELVAEVDTWISEGRISAAVRNKAVAAMKRDAETARDIYGANPVNTIPRVEAGYGKDKPETSVPSRDELINLARARRAKK